MATKITTWEDCYAAQRAILAACPECQTDGCENQVNGIHFIASIRDAKRGNVVVKTITTILTADEATVIAAEMRKEIKARAKQAKANKAVQRAMNAE